MSDVSVIGAGSVGSALVEDSLTTVAEQAAVATTTSNAEAAADADTVVLAVPFAAVQDVVGDLADELAGKIVIDATNPLAADLSGQATDHVAGAELVQEAAPRPTVQRSDLP